MTAPRRGSHDGSHGGPAGAAEAVMVSIAAFAMVPLVGGALQVRLGVAGLALTEVTCVLAPALAAIAWSRARAGAALGLGWPPRGAMRVLLGALLVGLGGFYLVAGGVESLQERVAPMGPALREQMRRLIVPASGLRPLALDLLLLAAVPAVCEETLFRGVLLRALAPAGRGSAVLLTSLAFGAFHYSPYKLAPTAALGVLLGVLALRSGSLVAPMVAHAVNNALVVVLVRAGRDDPPGAGDLLSALWLLAALGATGAGLRLATAPGAGAGPARE